MKKLVFCVNNFHVTRLRTKPLECILSDTIGTMNSFMVILGFKLNLYRTLSDHKRLKSEDLGKITNSSERYIQERLRHQLSCDYVSGDNEEYYLTDDQKVIFL